MPVGHSGASWRRRQPGGLGSARRRGGSFGVLRPFCPSDLLRRGWPARRSFKFGQLASKGRLGLWLRLDYGPRSGIEVGVVRTHRPSRLRLWQRSGDGLARPGSRGNADAHGPGWAQYSSVCTPQRRPGLVWLWDGHQGSDGTTAACDQRRPTWLSGSKRWPCSWWRPRMAPWNRRPLPGMPPSCRE